MIEFEQIAPHAHRITVMAEFRQADAEALAGFVKDFEHWVGIGTWVLIGLMLIGYVFRVMTWKPRESTDDDV